MAFATIQPAFAAGELAPSLYGRVDLAKYHIGAATLRNFFVNYRGGAASRPGTCFVGQCKQPGTAAPPRLINFQFNVSQGYVLEFGDNYLRFIFNGGYIVETPLAIIGITKANPAVVTVTGQPFNNGDWVFISGVYGMPQINDRTFIVHNAASGSFSLLDTFGNAVNSTNWGTPFPNSGTVARIYEIATPYAAVDLPLLKYSQSADVMSLTHPSYPPYDLNRFGTANWTLTLTNFGEQINAPLTCSATATVTTASNSTAYAYVVTAVNGSGEESIASPVANVGNSVDIAAQAGSINVNWSPVSGASYYNVYKAPAAYSSTVPIGSLFGFVGQGFGSSFVDSNITADFTKVPPVHNDPFSVGAITAVTPVTVGTSYAQSSTTVTILTSAGTGAVVVPVVSNTGGVSAYIVQNGGQNYSTSDKITIGGAGTGATATLSVGPVTGTYPGVVSYFQQRRAYAASLNNPQTYWLSKPYAFTNFDTSIPTVDDDSITGTPWSLQVNGIQFMAGMPSGIVLFTGGGEWLLSGGGAVGIGQQAITPANQIITPQGYHGCGQLCPPIPVDYDILFVQAKGSIVRVLQYNYWVSIYLSSEITTLSNHLFQGHFLREWAWAEEPFKLAHAVREDGVLLTFTYFKEQDVYAWSRYDTSTT